MKTLFALLLLSGLFLSSCNTARLSAEEQFGEEEVATFILVRHAEKDYGRDPILIPIGVERAERLKEILKNTDLDAIYSTKTQRTQQTAGPTAEEKNLKVISYDPAALQEFATHIKRLYRGKTVLIVGHSNTTPAMANYLTGSDEHPRFDELDYTNLYVVTLPRIGKPRVLKLRY